MAASQNTGDEKPFTVAIVGAGLVGSLAGVFFAKRGWQVNIYELRQDMRKNRNNSGRSINLALSVRGISALTAAGVEAPILKSLLPMKGRMIHSLEGKLTSQPYGLHNEHINSVDRRFINEHLLSTVENFPNVKLHFGYDLKQADFDAGILTFQREDGSIDTVVADFILGADGAYSRVRGQLLRRTRMSFSQQYIDHGWCELTIPPTASGDFAMEPNHLHIWPRHTFMMIALPNPDKSFTVTLFMPWEKFNKIATEADLLEFFETTFPDAIPLVGKDLLVKDYFKNPKGSLISVKCKPYHYKHKVVIVGDAAHAMVPFYGQGMNCGFEDLVVLNEILDKHLKTPTEKPSPDVMAAALEEYTATRNKDAEAMCDLALYNYTEMRSSVVKTSFLIRKTVEGWLHRLMPKRIIPLYTMVSFTRIPYSEALRRWQEQTKLLNTAAYATGGLGAVSVLAALTYVGLKKAGIRSVSWLVEKGKLSFS
ncbi:hypothetical protein HK102_009468 [Quaeritorhiza haematococci]|nr:hypothetical protein HK102_009468 [Quaeritorhiza haematococci]